MSKTKSCFMEMPVNEIIVLAAQWIGARPEPLPVLGAVKERTRKCASGPGLGPLALPALGADGSRYLPQASVLRCFRNF